MPGIVAVHSWRGGTGKSTVVAKLGRQLAGRGLRIGLVDASLHAPGLHEALDLDVSRFRLCLWDYLSGVCEIEEARHEIAPGLVLVPARTEVAAITLSAASGRYDAGLLYEGFHRLVELLELDLLFVDTHSGANHEAVHAIACADVDMLITRACSGESRTAGLSRSIAAQLGRAASEPLLVVNMVPPALDPSSYAARVGDDYGMPVAALLPRVADHDPYGPARGCDPLDALRPELELLGDRVLDLARR